MHLDPAITRSLSLFPSATTTIAPHGHSGFSKTFKLTTTLPPGTPTHFFLKIGHGPVAVTMFAGEHASLTAIHAVVPSLCPASFAHGPLDNDPEASFLVTEFLDLSTRGAPSARVNSVEKDGESSGMSLAAKLATLHTTPAPVPAGFSNPVFGFPVPTCCGSTVQPNGYKVSWADFYAENRLRAVLSTSERANGTDCELRALVEKTAAETVPRLLGGPHLGGEAGVVPVVVHGDLWSGNKGWARKGGGEEVLFDAGGCWAHGEFELGMMRMFGGFGEGFMREYHALCPKAEPVGEYEDRVSLYEL